MKTILIVISILILIVTGIYFYIRFSVLRSKDFKPDNTKSKSTLDLRPRLIAKLQQLVKDGSSGLYNLSITEIEPRLNSGGVDITGMKIVPDSVTLSVLKSTQDAPGEVVKLSIDSFHIDGLGIEDLLHKSEIDLKTISFTRPLIEIFKLKEIPGKKKNDTISLYQKIMKQFKRISINQILVQHGTVINHNFGRKNQTIKLDDVDIKIDSIRIDSSTQFADKRFLFAEEVQVSARDIKTSTADNLYFLKCESINISTRQNTITARNISFTPRYTREQFESKFQTRKYMFTLAIPKLALFGIDWWKIVNGNNLVAKEAMLEYPACGVYLDRSLPFRKIKQNNFPHQVLMRMPLPFSIAKMKMRHAKLLYTEYNPGTGQTGNVVVSDVNGMVANITNIPKEIRRNRFMISQSSGSFMNRVPLDVAFHFDLLKYRTGNFTMDLKVGGMDSSVLNPITGPLAEFIFKRGSISEGTVHVEGNNFKASGKGMLLYKDLYLEAVKKKPGEPGKIKKRRLISFIGNVLLIKNSNPSNGKAPRKETFSSERNDHQPFFSLVWKTIYIGVLKSIGLPPAFGNKSY